MADTERPSWDEYFMTIAHQVATRCTCKRRRVGAVLVRDRQILCTGYNGVPRGIRHCVEAGCIREQRNVPSGERHELCRGIHAEMNAIIQAAKHGTRIDGATLYCTTHPCSLCAKMLINVGIQAIYIDGGYPDALATEMLAEAKIPVFHMPPPPDPSA